MCMQLQTINVGTPMCIQLQKDHICTSKSLYSMLEFSGLIETNNNKKHCGLGSKNLLQQAFPGESYPNFPWEKSQWDNKVVKYKSN